MSENFASQIDHPDLQSYNVNRLKASLDRLGWGYEEDENTPNVVVGFFDEQPTVFSAEYEDQFVLVRTYSSYSVNLEIRSVVLAWANNWNLRVNQGGATVHVDDNGQIRLTVETPFTALPGISDDQLDALISIALEANMRCVEAFQELLKSNQQNSED